MIKALHEHFNLEISPAMRDSNFFVTVALNYIYEKLVKIADKYKPYFRYKEKSNASYVKNVNAFIKRLKNSRSHISFKVKGAVLYLKYYNEIFDGKFSASKPFNLDIQYLSDLTVKIK
jgi:hypothetical protein